MEEKFELLSGRLLKVMFGSITELWYELRRLRVSAPEASRVCGVVDDFDKSGQFRVCFLSMVMDKEVLVVEKAFPQLFLSWVNPLVHYAEEEID